ncbi:MAG: L-lactate permease [Actinomycetota bacterium]|nr:L-lactate permease [Actinomycetota bacterium]
MYQQVLDPVGGSLGSSAIFAVLPLATLFLLLGGLRMKAHWASLIALAVALAVATIAYPMPVGQALDAAALGAVFGLFPIMWIVVNAIWLYNMTTKTGHFEVLRRSFGAVSPDQRVQAIVIAFSFGALLEALAGFGTPVAITAVMLIALGFKPVKAASVALVANTAPVAFGALAIPIITLAEVTGLPQEDLGAMVGRQTPFLAVIVPLILVGMVDGRRGLRQAWLPAAVGGLSFALGQFAASNYFSVELADVVAALVSAGAIIALLRVWSPSEPLIGEASGGGRPAVAGAEAHDPKLEAEVRRREGEGGDSRRAVAVAYAPYLILIAVFSIAQIGPVNDALNSVTAEFPWPGLNVVDSSGEAPDAATFTFNWLEGTGTLVLIAGLITAPILRIGVRRALKTYAESLDQLKWAILTVAAVLALAFVMNLSGQTITLGLFAAGAGSIYALIAPIVGWLGVAVTGSDTSSNALFGALQLRAAREAGLDPVLITAASSSGGVLGKVVSPQNLAIGAAAVGMGGQEGDLFRRVIGWSLLLLALMCVIVYLQSTAVLSWLVV